MAPFWPRRLVRALAGSWLAASLVACERDPKDAGEGRPVRVETVASHVLQESVTLTGAIEAQQEVALAFRTGGKIAERSVSVGDVVEAGALVATLDATVQQNEVQAAKATLAAARGELATARNTYERQERLMAEGFTTRPRYDAARNALETAEAKLEAAEAGLDDATERLAFTRMSADAGGVVTAVAAEPGEVVEAGQRIVTLAREGGRDAVFDVPARLLDAAPTDTTILVTLTDRPGITATGRIREVDAKADETTRTFKVRVGLDTPPDSFQLGAGVTGQINTASNTLVAIPSGALTRANGAPAVWVIDAPTSTVALRNVDVLRFEPRRVVLAQGLEPGEQIVTQGIQALHPGQRILAIEHPPARPEGEAVAAAAE
jgi:RND family efflux transporter MFP subunit